jgi:SlyX protein
MPFNPSTSSGLQGERTYSEAPNTIRIADLYFIQTPALEKKMTEERIIDLETRLSYMEASLDELIQTVMQQQNEIAQLTNALGQHHKMLNELSPSSIADPAEETPPPHY